MKVHDKYKLNGVGHVEIAAQLNSDTFLGVVEQADGTFLDFKYSPNGDYKGKRQWPSSLCVARPYLISELSDEAVAKAIAVIQEREWLTGEPAPSFQEALIIAQDLTFDWEGREL